jgi:hypothetical protein
MAGGQAARAPSSRTMWRVHRPSAAGRRCLARGLVAVAVWVGCGLADARAQDAAAQLVGRWDGVTRSAGGIGEIIELRADGSMTHWFAAMVEFTYVVQGFLLTTSFTPASGAPVEQTTTEIRFEGNVLIQRSVGSGLETRMDRKRAGGPLDPPIVGVWSYPHDTGRTAYMLYTADGRLIFRLPIRADRGRWSVSGDQLTMGPLPATARLTYRMQGDQLVLIDEQGKETSYMRAEILEFP